MTGSVGACAVCKHQRRKCEPNCELAAYFPANRMNDFRALHLVFGVANLTKLIKANATETARRRAAETLTWEARWRERDPSEGCYREVSGLRRENAVLRAQNAALRRQAEQCAGGGTSALQQQQQQMSLLVSAYGGANGNGNFNVGSCYNGSTGGGRAANGNGAVRPRHVPTPAAAAHTMLGYAPACPAADVRNGAGVPRSSDATITIKGDKSNAR